MAWTALCVGGPRDGITAKFWMKREHFYLPGVDGLNRVLLGWYQLNKAGDQWIWKDARTADE